MRTIKFKLVFQISLITSLSLMLCACQMDDGKSAELSPQMEHTQSFDNEYSKALDAYDAFMCGDIGLNNSQIFTIAPTAESKYAILDINDDGIPELAVTTVIFQERDSDTLELESTSFDSAIFSYKNGEVFIWAGGDRRHNNFEILSNKALLYDCNDGHGGREIIYHELDENGDISCEIEMWNNPDGRYYLIDHAQNDSQVEISEDEWHETVDAILALRTDLIPWMDWTESLYACQTDGTGHNAAEQASQSEYQMLAERVGPLLFACDEDEHIGEFSVEGPEDQKIYISEDGESIVVAYFFLMPIFIVPLEEPVEAEITPEQVLAEQLTEITPEQALAEQLIDDTRDAFLVDTGGKLGTLLVTAELERTPTEDCDFTVCFVVWNPASMNEAIQILTAGTNIFGGWNFIDANFDSYMDFTFTYLRGNASYYDHLWIWNEEYGEFVNISEYDKISIPSLDMETQTIYGFNRSSGSGTGTHTYHQWIKGDLLCIRCIDIDQNFQSKIFHMSVQDRIGGEMVEIYQEDFAPESDKWHDAEMAWHDLDYHGEPAEEK